MNASTGQLLHRSVLFSSVLVLLLGGVALCDPSNAPFSELQAVVKAGDLESAKRLVEKDPALLSGDAAVSNLLNTAAWEGYPALVAWFAERLPDRNKEQALTSALAAAVDLPSKLAKQRLAELVAAASSRQKETGTKDASNPATATDVIRESRAMMRKLCRPLPPDILQNKVLCIEELLRARAKVQTAESWGSTARPIRDGVLRTAIMNRFPTNVVAALVKAGAIHNFAGEQPSSLMTAAIIGDAGMVRDLIAQGAPVDMVRPYTSRVKVDRANPLLGGLSALDMATLLDDQEIARVLVDCKANPNGTNSVLARPLHFAAGANSLRAMDELIRRGADVDARDRWSRTPMVLAASVGNTAAVNLLLDHGALVEVADGAGFTPLLSACEQNHLDTVKALLDRGASLDRITEMGKDALAVAATADAYEVAEYLIGRGEPANGRTRAMASPLGEAVGSGHPRVVKLLLDHGASVEREYMDTGFKLIHIAVMAGRPSVHVPASKRRVVEESEGYGALILPSEEAASAILRLLIEKGADVDVKGRDGNTPLHLACKGGDEQAVRLLLESGATPGLRNGKRETPMDVAEAGGFSGIAALLKEAPGRAGKRPTTATEESLHQTGGSAVKP